MSLLFVFTLVKWKQINRGNGNKGIIMQYKTLSVAKTKGADFDFYYQTTYPWYNVREAQKGKNKTSPEWQ